jgi:hypothetical protein
MAIHDKFAALAERLIAKNGRDVVLYKLSRTAATPAKPWEGAGTGFEDSATVKAVITDYNEDEIDGEIIRQGDKKLLVAAKPSPTQDLLKFDKLDDAGSIYSVVRGNLLKPGVTSILYKFQIRG